MIVVVLHEPQDLVNIAHVVRGMKNFGVRDLRLVNPREYEAYRVEGIAHQTQDVLARVRTYATLEEALADCVHIVGFTARGRTAKRNLQRPRDAAAEIVALATGAGGPVALLFGREDKGLSNEALDRCHRVVTIPSDPGYASLNLGHAVIIMLYELALAQGVEARPFKAPRRPSSCTVCTSSSRERPGAAGSYRSGMDQLPERSRVSAFFRRPGNLIIAVVVVLALIGGGLWWGLSRPKKCDLAVASPWPAGVDNVKLFVVGGKTDPVGFLKLVSNQVELCGLCVEAIDRLLNKEFAFVSFVIDHAAITWIGKPYATIGVNNQIVRRIEWLALPFIRKGCDCPVVFIAHYSTRTMLTRNLAAFPVKRVAIAIVRWVTEHAYVSIFGKPSMLDVVRNVAPDEVAPNAIPGRTFGPQHSCVQALDSSVAEFVFRETWIQNNDVSIRIANGRSTLPIISCLAQGRRGERRGHTSADKATAADCG